MTYTPNPTDPTNPLDSTLAQTASAEFRAIKTFINTYHKNYMIGVNMDTLQVSRGTTFTSPADATKFWDMWTYRGISAGGGTVTITRSSVLPCPVSLMGYKTNNSGTVTVTNGSVLAAGDLNTIENRIEGQDTDPIQGIPITLSFYSCHSVAGNYYVALQNTGQDQSCVAMYTQAIANTWQKNTITFPASPTTGTWDYGNGIGYRVCFVMAAGSTFQTATIGVWQSGNFVCGSDQTNLIATTGNVFKFQGMQLEPGNYATPFIVRTIQEEALLAKRYIYRSFRFGVVPAQGAGANSGLWSFPSPLAAATKAFTMNFRYPYEMRAGATVTLYNPINSNAQAYDAVAAADCSATSVTSTNSAGFVMTVTPATTTVAGNPIEINFLADASL